MKFYGKAEETAELIIQRFKDGNVGAPLADIFLQNEVDKPCIKWSWGNKFVMVLNGTNDARGFKQWQEVGRKVKKGAKSFQILAPITVKKEYETEEGETKTAQILVGFKSVPVFGIEQTEVFDQELWEKHSTPDEETKYFLQELPLRKVADNWGLEVGAYNGAKTSVRGYYLPGQEIALGTKNIATWTHELIHAAEDKLGALSKNKGKEEKERAEVVAELGGCTLAIMLGYEIEADIGGAWQYIYNWSGEDTGKAISMCMNLIGRVCNAIELILAEYEKYNEKEVA